MVRQHHEGRSRKLSRPYVGRVELQIRQDDIGAVPLDRAREARQIRRCAHHFERVTRAHNRLEPRARNRGRSSDQDADHAAASAAWARSRTVVVRVARRSPRRNCTSSVSPAESSAARRSSVVVNVLPPAPVRRSPIISDAASAGLDDSTLSSRNPTAAPSGTG